MRPRQHQPTTIVLTSASFPSLTLHIHLPELKIVRDASHHERAAAELRGEIRLLREPASEDIDFFFPLLHRAAGARAAWRWRAVGSEEAPPPAALLRRSARRGW